VENKKEALARLLSLLKDNKIYQKYHLDDMVCITYIQNINIAVRP
jgi:hypothetical protein